MLTFIFYKSKKDNRIGQYENLRLLISYAPALSLQIINVVFRFVFSKMQAIEEYTKTRAATLLLLR